MARRRILAAPALALLVLTLGSGAVASEGEEEIHACRLPDGDVVYQSDPCPEPPPAAPSPSNVPPAARALPPAPARPERRAAVAGKVTQKPRASFILVPPSLRSDPADPGRQRPGEPIRGATGPLDPRFASPEKTWQTFRTALGVNDRETARQCLVPSAAERLGPRIDSPGAGGIAWVVDETARVQAEGEAGPYWSLRVGRAHERPRWVFLVRTASGEWKIAAL